ncbi:MAG TPA: hypothetical protein VEQ87_16780 [Burkholderiales bacterium]|nr:hypothetical protein [Burkholderiales bacterium]
MKLFKIEVRFKRLRRGRTGLEAIVHAKSKAAAEKHVEKRFTRCEIVSTIELDGTASKHFVIADVVDD